MYSLRVPNGVAKIGHEVFSNSSLTLSRACLKKSHSINRQHNLNIVFPIKREIANSNCNKYRVHSERNTRVHPLKKDTDCSKEADVMLPLHLISQLCHTYVTTSNNYGSVSHRNQTSSSTLLFLSPRTRREEKRSTSGRVNVRERVNGARV